MAASNKLALLSRSLSTSSNVAQMIKPPIQVFGVEGRYATALFSGASKMKQLDSVEKDLVGIQQAIKENPTLRDYIISPIINRKVMAVALRETCEKLRMQPATSNILQLLADNGRMKKLNGIINSFRTIMAAHRGEVVCEVVTAKPLESSQRKELENALKAFLEKNETIHLTARVDPNIIGGMIVSIGDKYVDMSIASKVKMYTDLISASA